MLIKANCDVNIEGAAMDQTVLLTHAYADLLRHRYWAVLCFFVNLQMKLNFEYIFLKK